MSQDNLKVWESKDNHQAVPTDKNDYTVLSVYTSK